MKQALRSKFLVNAKGWYWQTLQEIGCQLIFCESGCQPINLTTTLSNFLSIFAVKLLHFRL